MRFIAWLGTCLLLTFPALAILASPLSTPHPEADRDRLIEVAASLLGTPYRYGGLDRTGLDCSGFLALVFREALGAPIPRRSSALYRWTQRVDEADLLPGDLLFFTEGAHPPAVAKGGEPLPGVNPASITHVGLYLGEGRFIHAASTGPVTGVIISSLDESHWRACFAGGGRALE